VLLVESGHKVGGACVHQGTIPSKTMREVAAHLLGLRERVAGGFQLDLPADMRINALLRRLSEVVGAHERFMADQVERNGITIAHGRARFESADALQVQTVRDGVHRVTGDVFVIATGSRPRAPADFAVDHEHVLDSDSILSLTWLPRSLCVLGGGVIASEYASIFAALGVEVTIVDRAPRPLMFLDEALSQRFIERFERFRGCQYLGSRTIRSVAFDGQDQVEVVLEDGECVRADKVLCALGRVANLDRLDVRAAGLETDSRGLLPVDGFLRTAVPHIYAVGDVIGAPALASAAMEQGRRAVRHALGLPLCDSASTLPIGIYTVPEISTVGMSKAEVVAAHGSAICGEARFDEVARAWIAGCTEGHLELVCDPTGTRVLGAQVFGEGATELIHVAQMAIIGNVPVDALVENIFNFPTLHEAYRVAALDVVRRREGLPATVPAGR
jgi:NAD(P) transhydrogenase